MDIYSEDFLNGFMKGIQDAIDSQDVDPDPFLKMLPMDWQERFYNYRTNICTNVKNYNINFEAMDQSEFDLAFEDLEDLVYNAGFINLSLYSFGRQGGWLGFNLSDLLDNDFLVPADKSQIKEWINKNPLSIKYYTESEYLYYGDPLNVGRDLIRNCDNPEDIMSLVVINPDLIDLLDSIRERIDHYFKIWEKEFGFKNER